MTKKNMYNIVPLAWPLFWISSFLNLTFLLLNLFWMVILFLYSPIKVEITPEASELILYIEYHLTTLA